MTLHNDTTAILTQQDTELHVTKTHKSTPSTGDGVPEYWVTRVVRQMKGCSPSRIDSVIQANLPPRKINWSQRPDTLEIPGLEGRIPYTIDNLPKCYELGYFRGNELLHPEIAVKPQGFQTEPVYHAMQDNMVGSIIILCFILISVIIHRAHTFLAHQAHCFFLQPNNKTGNTDAATSIGPGYMILAHIALSATGGLLFFHYAQEQYNLFLCPFSHYILLGIYIGITALFLVAKRALSGFINWIFFDKTSRHEWRLSYNFLLVIETAMMLALTAVTAFMHLTPEVILTSTIVLIGAFKITLLYKAYNTFLFKIYGFLHLLSYLCALEIIPLLALWVICDGITEHLTTIF